MFYKQWQPIIPFGQAIMLDKLSEVDIAPDRSQPESDWIKYQPEDDVFSGYCWPDLSCIGILTLFRCYGFSLSGTCVNRLIPLVARRADDRFQHPRIPNLSRSEPLIAHLHHFEPIDVMHDLNFSGLQKCLCILVRAIGLTIYDARNAGIDERLGAVDAG